MSQQQVIQSSGFPLSSSAAANGDQEMIIQDPSPNKYDAYSSSKGVFVQDVEPSASADAPVEIIEDDRNPVPVMGADGFRTDDDVAHRCPFNNACGHRLLHFLDKISAVEAKLNVSVGMEADPLSRKRAEDRPSSMPWYEYFAIPLMWASGNITMSSFSTGFVGASMGLTLRQSLTIIFMGCLIGSVVPAACAIFGAPMGLRQGCVSRFSFGWWPSKVIQVLIMVDEIGWGSLISLNSGGALTAASDGKVTIIVGVVIVTVVALILALFGVKILLVYDHVSWLVGAIVFSIMIGESAKWADNPSASSLHGTQLAGAVMSYLAIVYGVCSSWGPIASDYYVHFPANMSIWTVSGLTFLGMSLPTAYGMAAGAVVAAGFKNNPKLAEAYALSTGYAAQEAMYPRGFSKFLCVLLMLCGISSVTMCIFSTALAFQQFSKFLGRIPRLIWVPVSFGIIIGVAIGVRNNASDYLQDLLDILGYWSTSYAVIIVTEHVVFRHGSFENYDLAGWNHARYLPHGIGASVGFLIGVVAWVMGMNLTWYQGPLALLFGDTGGDVANEFTFVVTLIVFVPVRYWEIKYFGK